MTHHGAGLRRLNVPERLIDQLVMDYTRADVSPRDRAMLDYAIKLTRTPWAIAEADIRQLRLAGFSNAAILDICQITGYFNFVNRLADGLGVQLEPYWKPEEIKQRST